MNGKQNCYYSIVIIINNDIIICLLLTITHEYHPEEVRHAVSQQEFKNIIEESAVTFH